MKVKPLEAEARIDTGKKASKKLRREDAVPCVLYGGEKVVYFAAMNLPLEKLIYTTDIYSVKIKVAGAEYDAIIKEVQYHPVTDRILHVDFMELITGTKIIIDVPIIITGNPVGVRESGGMMDVKLRSLKVRAIPREIPDSVELNVNDLDIGQNLKVEDLELGELEILEREDAVIAGVRLKKEFVEPEIVTEGEEGEEGEEAEAASGEGEGDAAANAGDDGDKASAEGDKPDEGGDKGGE